MKHIGIIGGGPAGLMAAEVLCATGHKVTVYEAMPTVGRKFLMAGKSGLNLTHAEPHADFLTRFGTTGHRLRPILDAFTGADAREWAAGLGQETFTGSSGRVFPVAMKASPLLRAWLARLEARGVTVLTRHRWVGFAGIAAPLIRPGFAGPLSSFKSLHWSDLPFGTFLNPTRGEGNFVDASAPSPPSPLEGEGLGVRGAGSETSQRLAFQFDTPTGPQTYHFDAVILALGGASWPRLGADAAWVPWLADKGIPILPFRPANCGFDVDWPEEIGSRFAGMPVKSVAATSASGTSRGEFVITRTGIEGSLVYTHSAALRDALERDGEAILILDLLPGRDAARIARDLEKAGRKASFSNRLRKAGLDPVKAALVRAFSTVGERSQPQTLAARIKALPLPVERPRPIAEAISSAGGIAWEAVDENLMLEALPGVFVAGEMLDWEAPTGGYLLTACLATGCWAGKGVRHWLERDGMIV
ncbi:TIGR03862 family flavoprotein [Pelagibacterium sediminicola]|uniref:TIGR03862 family flavoprotein n=1 Tax=Pelagibacterium sediminicola TaxID=2248761 RepID=UPI001FEB7439|nr:TIGR03862 family flavoprotein [Pelagibacterium sediminicola]